MLVTDSYFQSLIAIQNQALRNYFLRAGVLVIVGFGVMVCSFFFSSLLPAELNKNLLTIAGGFISSLSALPFASVPRRREKLATLELLRRALREAVAADDAAGLEEVQKHADVIVKNSLES